ncbi:hypothetical protein F9C07_1491773 [Aspergillus flavus]|uniref:Uncharacterized protein n=1 Tax=Aspergillus flavus (strain ATCC 200026 / FGSC A1120 / IAM 13836 / NRRL 3357 / JCM 12722 / SRRC 167) TaxID=332952 RepID=A0A7U2MTB0_ASPFN|nr:hypothetical protein F9C07_1491773 [Aspergillus flavus]
MLLAYIFCDSQHLPLHCSSHLIEIQYMPHLQDMSDNSAVSFYKPDMRPVKDPGADDSPDKPRVCLFCNHEVPNLIDHLLACMWRIWPLQSHDALYFKHLKFMKPYIALNEASYKCPRCSLIVRGRGQLICHVAHACKLPYTLLYDHCIDIWDPETNRLWEPSGPSPFLRLPLGEWPCYTRYLEHGKPIHESYY